MSTAATKKTGAPRVCDGLPPDEVLAACHAVLEALMLLTSSAEFLASDDAKPAQDLRSASEALRVGRDRIAKVVWQLQARARDLARREPGPHDAESGRSSTRAAELTPSPAASPARRRPARARSARRR